jgi:glycosyltransferase involved in cell wall biosynthesis
MAHKPKLLISVMVGIFTTDGTTVRAKRILKVLEGRYDISLITRGNSHEKAGWKSSTEIEIIEPINTKFWNIKITPFLFKRRFRIVYCSNDWFGFFTYWAFRWFFHYKIIFEAHSILSKEQEEIGSFPAKIATYRIMERFIIKHSDFVIVLSNDTYDFYRALNPNIQIVPVFINDFSLKNEQIKKSTNNKNKLIGLIGPFNNIFNNYSLEYLYKNIHRFNEGIQFLVIGECAERINNQRITYSGFLNVNEYIEKLQSLDAVLLCMRKSTFGPLNKILEPMFLGIPVFTTPAGFVGLDHIERGKDIIVCEENRMPEIMNNLIFDEDIMTKISLNAKINSSKYYGQKTNTEMLLSIVDLFK